MNNGKFEQKLSWRETRWSIKREVYGEV